MGGAETLILLEHGGIALLKARAKPFPITPTQFTGFTRVSAVLENRSPMRTIIVSPRELKLREFVLRFNVKTLRLGTM